MPVITRSKASELELDGVEKSNEDGILSKLKSNDADRNGKEDGIQQGSEVLDEKHKILNKPPVHIEKLMEKYYEGGKRMAEENAPQTIVTELGESGIFVIMVVILIKVVGIKSLVNIFLKIPIYFI